jgi:hypothetical protein
MGGVIAGGWGRNREVGSFASLPSTTTCRLLSGRSGWHNSGSLWRQRGDDVRMHREIDRMIYGASVCLITRWIATGAENAKGRRYEREDSEQ